MAQIMTHEITVLDKAIHCAGCEARIQSVLARMPGVQEVDADYKTQGSPSPWFLGFGWVMLLVAHYWNRSRHHGGGLPWVLSILWLATWVTLVNTAIFGIEDL